MADIVIPSGGVSSDNANPPTILSEVAIVAGKSLYKNTAHKADLAFAADAGDSKKAVLLGIALASTAIGQPVPYWNSGVLTVSSAPFTPGKQYAISPNNAGGIVLFEELLTTHWSNLIGWALSTTQLQWGVLTTGVQIG